MSASAIRTKHWVNIQHFLDVSSQAYWTEKDFTTFWLIIVIFDFILCIYDCLLSNWLIGKNVLSLLGSTTFYIYKNCAIMCRIVFEWFNFNIGSQNILYCSSSVTNVMKYYI